VSVAHGSRSTTRLRAGGLCWLAIAACASQPNPQPMASGAGAGSGGSAAERPVARGEAVSEAGSGGHPDAGSGTGGASSDAAAEAAAATADEHDDGGQLEDAATSPGRTGLDAVLCDGSPGITFAAVLVPGGFLDPGTLMMGENGSSFLIVDGTCQLYSQNSRLSRVVTDSLSDADLQRLREDFRLDSWPNPTRYYEPTTTVADGPTFYFALGRSPLAERCVPWRDAECKSTTNIAPNGDAAALQQQLLAAVTRFDESWPTASGDVRYLLVSDEGNDSGVRWSDPAGWPLGDPEAVALDQQAFAMYRPGMSQRAAGADGAALREVWRQFIELEVSGRDPNYPPGVSNWIPIRVANTRYQLVLRDSLPFENAQGLVEY
jgi:hypothetical protein